MTAAVSMRSLCKSHKSLPGRSAKHSLVDAYRLTAPNRLLAELDASELGTAATLGLH